MNSKLWLEVLLALPALASFIGIIITSFILKKLTLTSKYIYLYLIIAFTTDMLSRYLALNDNNLILVPIFGFLELTLFAMIYKTILFKENRLFIYIIAICLLFILIDIFTCNPSNVQNFHSYGRVLDGFTITFLSLYFYWKIINTPYKHNKLTQLNTAIFLFFLLNSIWFLTTNFLVNISYKIIFSLWIINIIAMTIFYSFLSFYLWKNGKTQK